MTSYEIYTLVAYVASRPTRTINLEWYLMRVCYVSSETEAMLTQCTVHDERDNFEIIYFNYTFILTFHFKTIVIVLNKYS